MVKNVASAWTKMENILSRIFSIYLIFYFLFISDVVSNFYPILGSPFQFLNTNFIRFFNYLIFHKPFIKNIYFTDSSWIFLASLSYFIIAIIIGVVWTVSGKQKNYTIFFKYVHTYARYYLAFVLFLFGFDKLTGNQFAFPQPSSLIEPVGNLDFHSLLWTFMGASSSYSFFTGLLETTAGILLLFRHTCTIGGLVALSVLINVLMIDIGYDVLVKIMVFHFILIAIYILMPDIKKLFKIFIFKQKDSLARIPSVIENPKYQWIHYISKFIVIAFAIFSLVNLEIRVSNQLNNPPHKNIVGIHQVKEFYLNHKQLSTCNTDSLSWKKIAINSAPFLSIEFMNDSIADYTSQFDTLKKTIELSMWNDSTFKCNLHYTQAKPNEWLFEGTFKKDSIRFILNKVDMNNFTLLKDRGKIKWVWY